MDIFDNDYFIGEKEQLDHKTQVMKKKYNENPENRKKMREYGRAYYAKNKEKFKIYNTEYKKKLSENSIIREKMKLYQKNYYQQNKEKTKIKNKIYRENNKEKINIQNINYNEKKKLEKLYIKEPEHKNFETIEYKFEELFSDIQDNAISILDFVNK